jgi:TRAP-type C4-dicarboxylate transport system permease large subunit
MAGIQPGQLSLAGMIAVVAWWVRSDPGAAPDVPRTTATPLDATFAAWPAILIFAVIVFGIFSRALTVAQAVAISVALTLAIGVAQTRLTWGAVWRACRESLIESVSILLVLAGAWLFADFATQSGMAEAFSMSVAQLDPSYLMLMLAIALIYLIMGMFLDPLAILVLTLPFLARLVADYDLNPVWLGVVIVKLLEIGLITPPVGLNVYIIAGVTRDMGIDRIFAGIGRFLAVDLLVLTILILFPAVSLLIPTAMGAVP